MISEGSCDIEDWSNDTENSEIILIWRVKKDLNISAENSCAA